MDSCTHCPCGTVVFPTTVWNDGLPPRFVCKLTLIVSSAVAFGPSFTHTLTEYDEPTYILFATLIDGPSNAAARLVTRRLRVPWWKSAVEFTTVELMRGPHPSRPPSSNVLVIPELSCGPPGGPAIWVMTTSSR